MTYDEPPAWWFAVREDLADSLLRDGKAAEAEKVMRQQLEYSPRDGRALHILAKALKAEDKTYDAQWIEQQFKTAWKNADTQLK
jgi:Flp pilus assembly protein TadD